MKRSIKNSIYTLPLLLLCFISLTTFSFSWTQFTQWFQQPWTTSQSYVPTRLQAFVNWMKSFFNTQKESTGSQKISTEQKETLISEMLKQSTLEKQIAFLDRKSHSYELNGNIVMRDYCNDLQNKLINIVTARDRIDVLNELKETVSNPESINQELNKIRLKIAQATQKINQDLIYEKTPLQAITQLYIKYTQPTTQGYKPYEFKPTSIEPSEEPDIYLTALNTIVIQKLHEDRFSKANLFEEMRTFTSSAAKTALMQAIATYDLELQEKQQSQSPKPKPYIQSNAKSIIYQIEQELDSKETDSDKLTYLIQQRDDLYKIDQDIIEKIDPLIKQIATRILGKSQYSTKEELKSAYKKLALKLHPDRNPTQKEIAEEEFKKIGQAHDALVTIGVIN